MAKSSLLIAITLLFYLPVAGQHGGKRIPFTKIARDTTRINSLLAQGKAVEEQVRSTSDRVEKKLSEVIPEKDLRHFEQALAGCQAMTY